jgi:single-stranded DNA-binding protein
MMAHVLVTGALFKAPEQRTSKAGKPFVTATIKAKDGDSAQWWRVIAFSESAQAELMRLTDGDALSVQGGLKVEIYAKDGGEPKLSLSITADHVLALRQPPRKKSTDGEERPAKVPALQQASARTKPAAPFDDAIPW